MSSSLDTNVLESGFTNPSIESAGFFRAALQAMARPGRIETVSGVTPPAPLSVAAGALILTICDPETGLFLTPDFDAKEVRDWVIFQTGAKLTSAEEADFALGPWDQLQPVERFKLGIPEYPDRSATLIVEMADLRNEGARLTGPGIQTEAFLSLPEIETFRANRARFPLGFDCFFVAGNQLAAMPRTTRVEETG